MEKGQLEGYMEFTSVPATFTRTPDLKRLLDAIQATQIHTFGWPIAPVIETNEYRPTPTPTGIRAEINRLSDPLDSFMRGYDYWSLDKDGTFYVLKSLFEDRASARPTGRQASPKPIYLDTRVVRTAEVFLRTARLYEALGVLPDEIIATRIEYGGLEGRVLAAANPRRFMPYHRKCSVESVGRSFQLSLRQYLDPDELKRVVYEVAKAVTEMCDFFDPTRSITDPMVDTFLQGRVP
jgi:hypothetical protein